MTLTEQYRHIHQTRNVVIEYCSSLPQDIYERTIPDLPVSYSIRALHGHIAECYLHWLGNFGLRKSIDVNGFENLSFAEIRDKYNLVDGVVDEFLSRFGANPAEIIDGPKGHPHERLTLSALWLFTHAATHEFHHKGQIVLLGRMSGHPAPDTDLVFD